MKLNPNAEIFIPDKLGTETALSRTPHLGIGAHQDDLEMIAIDGILSCFQNPVQWFTGVIVTNGSGSPRSGKYAHYSDEDMVTVRDNEQKKPRCLVTIRCTFSLDTPAA